MIGIQVSYTPPRLNPIAVLTAVTQAAAAAGAEHLLAASQPLVPVDTGELKASGRVQLDGHGAAVIYDAKAPDDFAYGIKQHEDMALNHPNGGQAKFLEQPMSSEAAGIAVAIAEVISKVL